MADYVQLLFQVIVSLSVAKGKIADPDTFEFNSQLERGKGSFTACGAFLEALVHSRPTPKRRPSSCTVPSCASPGCMCCVSSN
jgi:hypothetical protein